MYALSLGSVENKMWDWSIKKKKKKGIENNYKKELKIIPNMKCRNCPDCHANC